MELDKIFTGDATRLAQAKQMAMGTALTAEEAAAVAANPFDRMMNDIAKPPQPSSTATANDGSGGKVAVAPPIAGAVYTADQIAALVDSAETAEPLTKKTVKRLIAALDKAIVVNQELRMKHASDPTKFLESEADLDAQIKGMMQLAAAPELYPLFVEIVPAFLTLVTHENTDISIAAIELMHELTDEDVVPEDAELAAQGLRTFVHSLVENQLLQILVENLARLHEDDSADDQRGVFATLGIIENTLSLYPESVQPLVETTNLTSWLLTRLAAPVATSNRFYAAEMLSIITQTSPTARAQLLLPATHSGQGEGEDATSSSISGGGIGMEALLGVVAKRYRKRDPVGDGGDEQEEMENIFDALCALCGGGHSGEFSVEGKMEFVRSEGTELMVLLLKERRMSRIMALKTLTFAVAGLLGAGAKSCCERLVDTLGLKHIFAAFMKKDSKRLKRDYPACYSDVDEDEHSVSIILALFRHLTDAAPKFRLSRLYGKFSENDYAKVQRLVQLVVRFTAKLDAVEKELTGFRKALVAQGEDVDNDESIQAEFDAERRGGGLVMLQMLSLIVLHLMSAEATEADSKLPGEVRRILSESGVSVKHVLSVVRDYCTALGPDGIDDVTAEENEASVTAMSVRRERDRCAKMMTYVELSLQ